MSTVLVVAAHPDDEVLGAGATLARHVDSGDDVHAIVVSEGASSRYPTEAESELARAAQRSAEIIGFSSLRLLGLPDQRLDALPLIEVVQTLEPMIADLRPSTIYTHSTSDVNVDHGVVARAVWTSCRPYAAPWLSSIYAFETPSSTEWSAPGDTRFDPTLFVDVDAHLQRKLDAMACYEQELRDYPHPRSLRALRERSAYWGSHVGLANAEPFEVLRRIERS